MKVLMAAMVLLALLGAAGVAWFVRHTRRARASLIEEKRRKARQLWEGRRTAEVDYVRIQIDRELAAERGAGEAADPARAARLEELRDLLERIEAMRPQPVGLDRVLARSAERARTRHPELELRVDTVRGEDAEVMGDEALLGWAFEELIDNAVAHGQTTRSIVLAARREHDAVVLRVTDDGLGPDPTARARFYAPFTPRRASRGPGLGLYTVRHLLDRLGGEIRAELLPDRGLSQVIRIPHRSAAPRTDEMPDFSWIAQ